MQIQETYRQKPVFGRDIDLEKLLGQLPEHHPAMKDNIPYRINSHPEIYLG